MYTGPFLLAAAPTAHEQQLLDIDGTVFITLGLFLLLFLLLSQLLWKPYLRVRAERTLRVDGAREAAERMEKEAAERFARVEAELAEARRRSASDLAVARAEARACEQSILAQAHRAAQAALDEARGKLEAAMAKEKANLDALAQELGREAARKVLQRSVS